MGKYYKKLQKIFIILAVIIVSIPMCIISITSSAYQKGQYQSELQKSMSVRTNLTQNGLTTITAMLSNIMNNSAIEAWSISKTNSEYYYNSVQAYQQIRKISSELSLVECEVAVTLTDNDSFVISGKGTSTKEMYFRTETLLNEQQKAYIFEYFKKNNGNLVLPVYSENNLHEVYYIVKRASSERDLLYIVKLPYKTLFGNKHDQRFILFKDDQILAYSSNDTKDKELFDRVYKSYKEQEDLVSEEGLFKLQNKVINVDEFSNIGWNIIYINDGFGINTVQIILYILFFIMLLLLALLLSHLVTDRLYQPIKSVISEITSEPSDKSLDEFMLLKQNTNKIKTLSNQLQTALNENETLVTQRYYRDLLSGISVNLDLYKDSQIEEGNYCVALIEFQVNEGDQGENKIFLLKNNIYAYTQEHGSLYYISISYNSCAIIIGADTLSEAREAVLGIMNPEHEDIELKASISDIHSGIANISVCYKEALQILEYKYLYDKNKILTMEQIANLDLATYYYPLIIENQLIQCVVEGKEEGRDIFQELIRENIQNRNLSPSTLQNLIFALIGTISRIFQELKTTPGQLMEENIDFEKLYGRWNHSTIISQLQNIIVRIIEAINLKNSRVGDELLTEMLDYIHKNYSDDIMLIDLANEFNISTKYCSALFKRLKDENFKDYLNKYRIERAQEFINKDPQIKISDLSTMVGFNSSNSFIRVFSRYTGITPKAFADKIMKR